MSAAARDREEPPRCSVGTALPHRSVLHVLFSTYFLWGDLSRSKSDMSGSWFGISAYDVAFCCSLFVCRQHSSDHSTNGERTADNTRQKPKKCNQRDFKSLRGSALSWTGRLCHHHHSDHVINSFISIRHCPSLIPTADTNQCQWLRSGGQVSDIPPVNIIGYPTGDHGGTLCIDSVTTQALEVYAKVWCVETAPMSVYLVFGLNGPA